MTIQSACSSLTVQNQTALLRGVSAFGRGLAFRYVITPQVWGISGDGVIASFDGRMVDQGNVTAEVAYETTVDSLPVRFSITQPFVRNIGLEYGRQAFLSVPVGNVMRDYQCVLGIPTLPADLASSPSGTFQTAGLVGTAYVGDGNATRAVSLERSVIAISSDMVTRQLTVSVRLIGSVAGGSAPDMELGTYAATAPIDASTDNFAGSLTSASRAISGSINGRFFGPRAIEIGAALGATVAASNGDPGFTFNAVLLGVR